MRRFAHPLFSFAAPLLILLSILGFFQRQGSDRLQTLPVFFVGAGLIITAPLGRNRRRKKLLFSLRKSKKKD